VEVCRLEVCRFEFHSRAEEYWSVAVALASRRRLLSHYGSSKFRNLVRCHAVNSVNTNTDPDRELAQHIMNYNLQWPHDKKSKSVMCCLFSIPFTLTVTPDISAPAFTTFARLCRYFYSRCFPPLHLTMNCLGSKTNPDGLSQFMFI